MRPSRFSGLASLLLSPLALLLPLALVRSGHAEVSPVPAAPVSPASLYDIETKTLEGQPQSLAAYKGKVVLVVNLASKCGFTPQYAGLEALYEKYKDQGFVILGFPSNDFKNQEPGTAEEIRAFCTGKYNVTFPLFEKVVVLKQPGQSAVYTFLTTGHDAPKWNFTKYLVDKQGQVVAVYPSPVKPDDAGLVSAIEAQLAK